MKPQGTVRGILIEGNDGHEYLLGFGPTRPAKAPTLSRRRTDGAFEQLAYTEASKVAVRQLGITERHVIGPGWGKDLFLWMAFKAALKPFPPVPSWPTWRA
jgi:hypothetical protein